jgi:hypothetical protein
MRALAIGVCLLMVAARLEAQALPASLYTGAMIADWATTYADRLDTHSVEANPLTAPIVNANRPALWAVGAATDVGLAVGWARLTRQHRTLQTLGFLAGVVLRSAVAYHNYQRLQAWEASRPASITFGTVPSTPLFGPPGDPCAKGGC